MKKIQLILTNPCSQNWDDMQPSQKGRYCESCDKHIVDLTDRSDAELIQFFNKKGDNVCGRLLEVQLHRELLAPAQKTSWHWLLPLAMGAMILSPTHATELKPLVEQGNLQRAEPLVSNKSLAESSLKTDTITGTVVNEKTGEPLRGVKIKQKGCDNVRAITDTSGRFELALAADHKAATFIFELDRYTTIEKPLENGMIVKLPFEVRIVVGGVHSIDTYKQPLYVISSGKESCAIEGEKMKEIPPAWIENIQILKDAKATALYGAKAANGVILIEIKNVYAKQFDFSKGKKRK